MTTRLNKFIAQASGLSRRQADTAISEGRVEINGLPVELGAQVGESDTVSLDGKALQTAKNLYVILNKPVGYVCSRAAQDENPTVYTLLPPELADLKIAGRLDLESRGLVLLTNDGDHAQDLMHPSKQKEKVYEAVLERDISDEDIAKISGGVQIDEGPLSVLNIEKTDEKKVTIRMQEGRNRQIRRTFGAVQHTIVDLKRTSFGPYTLDGIAEGAYQSVEKKEIVIT